MNSTRRSGDRHRDRERDRDRASSSRNYDRSDSRESRRSHRDRDSYYEEEDDYDDDDDYDRSRSRRSERSDSRGDRDYDSRSDRYDYDREYPRSHHEREDREWERERDNSTRRPISASPTVSFSRPATYDPRLAQRALGRYEEEEDDRHRQLKDELGLSDEDPGTEKEEKRRSTLSMTITSPEVHARCLKMEQELQIARENEQKAQESLGKLQLLSKSQTAILKTTMMKKLQERDDQLEELTSVIKELEGKLEHAGVSFEVFTVPLIKSTTSLETNGNGAMETEGIAEIGAMKREMDRLMEENIALKKNASTSGQKPSMEEKNSTRVEELEAEKQQLEKKLKATQQQVVTLKKEMAAGTSTATATATAQDTLPPAAPATDAGEVRALQKKLADAEAALKTAQTKAHKLETELSTPQSQKEASTTSSHATSDKIRTLEAQLMEQTNAFQVKETAWEEKHAKLKTTAETELGKIKEQAKKAIFDLKKKLEVSTKGQDTKRKALIAVHTQLHQQKTEVAQLKAAIVAQQQQVPVLAKQVTDKILQRVQRQADAMAGVVENYKREVKERKRLFNLVQELKGNIRVLCRVRPISKNESAQGNKAVCKFTPEEITVAGEKGKVKSWEFDHVFDPQSTQEELFAEVKPLVTSVLDGYNVCIFAYGQTGSGKTHTMSGSMENPGINTRALQELFIRKVERQNEIQDEITVSIMEIYNEVIRDLLAVDAANTNLSVRQGPTGNFVPGLTTIPVQTLEEVFDLIKKGNKSRSTHATDMNEHSSRSHSILSIQLKSANLLTNAITNGRLFLVDLAGSERLSKTGAEGLRLKEAQNINKSLSALGDVIAARASKAKHVPYRNSSLTYLLQDALGGDSKTLMVACASPVDYNSEETFCTLNFAARARSVEMGKATKNVTAGPAKTE